MIPQRRLTRSSFGNGVSCRIEACRRRLRTVRANEATARSEERMMTSGFEVAGLKGATMTGNFDDTSIPGQDEAEIT